MNDKELSEQEAKWCDVKRMLQEELFRLDAAHQKARAPIVNRLVEMESFRTPGPFIVDAGQFDGRISPAAAEIGKSK